MCDTTYILQEHSKNVSYITVRLHPPPELAHRLPESTWCVILDPLRPPHTSPFFLLRLPVCRPVTKTWPHNSAWIPTSVTPSSELVHRLSDSLRPLHTPPFLPPSSSVSICMSTRHQEHQAGSQSQGTHSGTTTVVPKAPRKEQHTEESKGLIWLQVIHSLGTHGSA